MRLLAIEDDEMFARMLVLTLQPCGWNVDVAFRLSQAMVVLTHQKFDAVLVDLTLPDSGWMETLDRLPEIIAKARPARVIVTTGNLPEGHPMPDGVRLLRKAEEGILHKLLSAIGDPTPL